MIKNSFFPFCRQSVIFLSYHFLSAAEFLLKILLKRLSKTIKTAGFIQKPPEQGLQPLKPAAQGLHQPLAGPRLPDWGPAWPRNCKTASTI